MSKYLDVQDPFDKSRKVKALRPTVKMGGTTTRNGKRVEVGQSKEWTRRNVASKMSIKNDKNS
jgi:hypothetical protein